MIALFVALLWGISPVIHKHVLKNVAPKVIMTVGSIFYFLCMCLFVIYNWEFLKNEVPKLDQMSLLWIAIASIISAFIANVLYFYILKKHDSYVVSALIYASPVFTLLLAVMLLKEKVNAYGIGGVLLIVTGVILMAFNERKHF